MVALKYRMVIDPVTGIVCVIVVGALTVMVATSKAKEIAEEVVTPLDAPPVEAIASKIQEPVSAIELEISKNLRSAVELVQPYRRPEKLEAVIVIICFIIICLLLIRTPNLTTNYTQTSPKFGEIMGNNSNLSSLPKKITGT